MEEILEFLGGTAGWIVGAGLALGAASMLTDGGRPLVKKAIKGYLAASERVRVATAEMGENLQDLYAEARMEYDTDRAATNGASAGGGSSSHIVVPGRENG